MIEASDGDAQNDLLVGNGFIVELLYFGSDGFMSAIIYDWNADRYKIGHLSIMLLLRMQMAFYAVHISNCFLRSFVCSTRIYHLFIRKLHNILTKLFI